MRVTVMGSDLFELSEQTRYYNMDRDRIQEYNKYLESATREALDDNFGITDNGISPRNRELSDVSGDVFTMGNAFQCGSTT